MGMGARRDFIGEDNIENYYEKKVYIILSLWISELR